MLEKHKEFFRKLAKLCEVYDVTILDSGSIRKGVEVTFYNEGAEPNVYEKFAADLVFLKVTDENGDEHFYK